MSRTNNIDSMLVFTLLLAAWLLFRSVKRTSIWSLLGAFAVIGVAFNMKMLQAYMVLPAFYLFYFLAAKVDWKKRIRLLAGATVVLAAISLSWAVIVDSIPEDQRPYIGSSETNSVLELAFGYNGISRLTGDQGRGRGTPPAQQQQNANDTMKNDGTQTQSNADSINSTDEKQTLPPGSFEGGKWPGGEWVLQVEKQAAVLERAKKGHSVCSSLNYPDRQVGLFHLLHLLVSVY